MQLTSFEDVSAWDSEATRVLALISSERSRAASLLESALSNHSAKVQERKDASFFKRTFGSNRESKEAYEQAMLYQDLVDQLQGLADSLEHWINLTPDSVSEAKQMLAELKQARKELGAQKKEMRLAIKEVSIQARTQNAGISNQVLFTNAKLRRFQRVGVRAEKEKALKPLEGQIGDC